MGSESEAELSDADCRTFLIARFHGARGDWAFAWSWSIMLPRVVHRARVSFGWDTVFEIAVDI